MLQLNLLYTGVTRGKKLVVLVGQKKAVAIAVKNVSGRRRWSKLDDWLGGELAPQPFQPPLFAAATAAMFRGSLSAIGPAESADPAIRRGICCA